MFLPFFFIGKLYKKSRIRETLTRPSGARFVKIVFEPLFFFSFIFPKKKKKRIFYDYTGVRFKLVKYQHLDHILRENKLTYTKLISNVADSGTKNRIELSKAKKSQMS